MLKPKKEDEGLRPVAGSRLVAVNRKLYVSLYCKLGIRRDQPGYEYRSVLGLCGLMGVTRVYKGTTRRRFKDNRQQLETQAKRIRSMVIETLAIPQQLD